MTGICVSSVANPSFYFRETVLRSTVQSRSAFLRVFMRFLAPRRDPREIHSVVRSEATECTLLTRLRSKVASSMFYPD